MSTYLSNPGEGLSRYPDQQLLYQWPKFEQKAALPHGLFVGQIDPFANGDCWIISKFREAVGTRGVFLVNTTTDLSATTTTARVGVAYKAGDITLTLENLSTSATISKDSLVDAAIFIASGDGAGLSNRITSNEAAPVYSGSGNHPEFKVELENPWELAVAAESTVETETHKWSGLSPAGTTAEVVVAFAPRTFTAAYYGWTKTAGAAYVYNEQTTTTPSYTAVGISKGDALTISRQQAGRVREAAAGEQIVAIAEEDIAVNTRGKALITLGLM